MKIVTNYNPPPIPNRNFDWCAWSDGLLDEGPIGFGATEREAVEELFDKLEDYDGWAQKLLAKVNSRDAEV